MTKRGLVSLLVAGVVFGLVSIVAMRLHATPSLLVALQRRASIPANLAVAKGLVPPTNRWFSGLVFNNPQQTVYSYPLAYKPVATGFVVSRPKIITSADSINSPFTPDITVASSAILTQTVTAYDDLTITLELKSGAIDVAKVHLTEGSPFTFVNLAKNQSLSLTSSAVQAITMPNDYSYIVPVADRNFLISFTKGQFHNQVSGSTITLTSTAANALFSIGALSTSGNIEAFETASLTEILSGKARYTVTETGSMATYDLETTGNKPALFGILPMQNAALTTKFDTVASFPTLYGEQQVYSGNSYTYRLDSAPQTKLDLSGISTAQKADLIAKLKVDAAAIIFKQNDTYFGGKEMYRAAMLVQLARQLDQPAIASDIAAKLRLVLVTWLDPKSSALGAHYFYYDSTIHGLVGVKAGFGSEAFNDHHFHYGYMIYAAATIAEHDEAFKSQYGSMVDLIVKDIANSDASDKRFPVLRVFDRYTGHSNASGFAPFADGNNQESSSEAVNAWGAMYYWGQVTHNFSTMITAQYLYSNESHAALAYWLNIDKSQSVYAGYNHAIIDIVWGAKRDYATFFNNSPEAKLAIQVLPFSPADLYIASDSQRVNANIDALKKENGNKPFALFPDYLIEYEAVGNKAQAKADLANLDPATIDGGNSLTYIYAFIYTQK